MNQIRAYLLAVVFLLTMLAGCGGGGSDESSSGLQQPLRMGGGGGIEGTGAAIMQLSITATPACGYDAVHITIDRVRVNQSAAAESGEAGWSEVILTPPRRVELTTLANGVPASLGETALEPGRYAQMRLVLAPNTAANPLANSVTPNGGTETALATPSSQQGGLKLDVDLNLQAGQTSGFALDFDTCRSIVKRGGSGQYNLKPVISVKPVP